MALQSWLEQDAANRQIFDRENELWRQTGHRTQTEHYAPDRAWESLSSRLGIGDGGRKKTVLMGRGRYRILVGAACAGIVLLSGVLCVWALKWKDIKIGTAASTTVFTKESERSGIILPDSTLIYLNALSKLEYPGDFNRKDRRVSLTGEAYFDVHTDPGKPLTVCVDDMSIEATGTKFNVLSYKDEKRVEATLEEGTIVITMAGREPVHLQAGEQLVYYRNSKEVRVRKVAPDTYTSWKENRIRFYDTPMDEVLLRLAKAYNIDFRVVGSNILGYLYTGTFIDESIEEIMDMLSKVSPITYQINYRNNLITQTYQKPQIIIRSRKP